jgi:SAM-dependent methyltransferase
VAEPLQLIARALVPRALRPPLKRAVYYGRRHRCPVCESWVRRYLPEGLDLPVLRELDVVGAERRARAACPVCYAGTRTRLLWLYLSQASRLLERPARLLHIAPEPGLHRRLSLASNVAYYSGDLDPSRYPYASEMQRLDLTALPHPDGYFDAVLANHVLEHVRDDRRALTETLRVLRPGGLALLQVPIALRLETTREDPSVCTPSDRERVYGQRDHLRLYGRDYPKRLGQAGFEVRPWRARDLGDPEIVERLQLNPREVVFVARRPAA